MKRLQVLVALLATVAAGSLKAQSMNITAKIPFDFQLGTTAMPAGDYRVNRSDSVLIMRSVDGHHSALLLTRITIGEKRQEGGVLEFHRYGECYFFAGLSLPNSTDRVVAPKTSREKELASRMGRSEPAAIALSSR